MALALSGMDIRDSVTSRSHRMTSYNMYTRTVRDCFASALDVQDGGFTVPSTRAEIEKALHTFGNALLRRVHDVVASFAIFSCRKKRLWSEFHTIRSTELKEMWCMFLQNISIEEEDP